MICPQPEAPGLVLTVYPAYWDIFSLLVFRLPIFSGCQYRLELAGKFWKPLQNLYFQFIRKGMSFIFHELLSLSNKKLKIVFISIFLLHNNPLSFIPWLNFIDIYSRLRNR